MRIKKQKKQKKKKSGKLHFLVHCGQFVVSSVNCFRFSVFNIFLLWLSVCWEHYLSLNFLFWKNKKWKLSFVKFEGPRLSKIPRANHAIRIGSQWLNFSQNREYIELSDMRIELSDMSLWKKKTTSVFELKRNQTCRFCELEQLIKKTTPATFRENRAETNWRLAKQWLSNRECQPGWKETTIGLNIILVCWYWFQSGLPKVSKTNCEKLFSYLAPSVSE